MKFDEVIEKLRLYLTDTASSNISHTYIENILQSYNSNEIEWSKFALVNSNSKYTRNLIVELPDADILLLVWNPENGSSIHDHANSHCIMKILKGELNEELYNDKLNKIEEKSLKMNAVEYINDEIGYHKIFNPLVSEHSVSLHVYTPANARRNGCTVFDDNGIGHKMKSNLYSVNGDILDKGNV